jgi:SAM-dependent methyltransferase
VTNPPRQRATSAECVTERPGESLSVPSERQDDVVTADGAEDPWAALGGRFVDGDYGSLRGRVRTHVIHEHLRAHLASPPPQIVDVGGGAGHQSIPLARQGYDVTIVDPSAAMLERARDHIRRRRRRPACAAG